MTTGSPTNERLRLVGERQFLLRSIADLDAEHAAGDVGEDDYATLRADYVARAAEVLRALSVAEEPPGGASPARSRRFLAFRRRLGRRRTRRLLVAVGLACVLGVVGLASASLAGVRFPGESATGTVSLPKATEIHNDLAAAALLAGSGNEAEAVALYQSVLSLDPHQPEALAYRGWLVRLAGKEAHSQAAVGEGDRSLAEAVRTAPGYPDARAFYAIALYEDLRQATRASQEVAAFVADHPSQSLLSAYGHRLAGIDLQAGVAPPGPLRSYESGATART